MSDHQPLHWAPAHAALSPEPGRSRVVLIIHGPGKVTHIAALELAGDGGRYAGLADTPEVGPIVPLTIVDAPPDRPKATTVTCGRSARPPRPRRTDWIR